MLLTTTALPSGFGLLDGLIVVAYLGVILWVGVRVNRYISGMESYVVAGRALGPHLAIASMVGSELGLVTVMYAAQKGFTGGMAAFHIGLIAGVVTLIVGLTGFIVVPLRRLGVMTIPEFYEHRFGRDVRIVGGLILAGAGILNMGMFLRAGAFFLAGITGWTDPVAIKAITTLLLVIVLVYTILGGMISVVITDYFQFVLLSITLLAACAIAIGQIGWGELVDGVRAIHGEAGFDPLHTDGFGPDYLIWMVFTAGLVSCAVWQTAVIRACSAESTRVVRRLYVWSSVGFLIRFLVPQLLGVCALVWLWKSPEAHDLFFTKEGGIVDDPEQTLKAFPVFLGQILPAGLLGLVAAGSLAAFMSTHDSYLLCWASVLAGDVVAPASGERLSPSARLLLARIFIFAIGIFLLVWSLWWPIGQDLWDYMAVTGAVYFTGAFALLLFGLYWRRASRAGAYLALAAGLFAMLGLRPIRETLDWSGVNEALAKLHLAGEGVPAQLVSARIGLAAVVLAVSGMVIGSLLFPRREPPAPAEPRSEVRS